MSVSGQTILQGPSIGSNFDISILGTGFPLVHQLQPYAPSIRVYFGNLVQTETVSAAGGIVTIESSTRINIRVPSIMLGVNESSRHVLIYLSIDNLLLLPKGGLPFTFFQPATIERWFPLYGLFETETVVTIFGKQFVDTGEARCRFQLATCDSEDGKSMTPCLRRATYLSPTQYTCIVPSRRTSNNNVLNPTNQKLQFSPYAPASLKTENAALYEQQFVQYTSTVDFNFHSKFTDLYLDAFSAPVNAPALGTDERTLLIDSSNQKTFVAGSNAVCLSFQRMHRQGAVRLALRNDGATVHTRVIPLQIDNVLDTLGGCPQLDGYCVGQMAIRPGDNVPDRNFFSCAPSLVKPLGSEMPEAYTVSDPAPEGCCEAPGMDPVTCCPIINDPRWQQDPTKGVVWNDEILLETAGKIELYDSNGDTISYAGKCRSPNIRKYPAKVTEAAVEICPVSIKWRLPTIKMCRGGKPDTENQHCNNDMDCGTGRCQFMPMNSVLQVSTNGGQDYSGPATTTILFYNAPQVQAISPQRVVKDCGESQPGKMDCGWGASWQATMLPAASTFCGLETFCARRQSISFTMGPGLVTGPCMACNKIYVNRKAFADVKCRFQVQGKSVLANALYEGFDGYSTVSCQSPVLNEPSLVEVGVALDGKTFITQIGDPFLSNFGQKTSVVFIQRPEVIGVVPTNGIFDANTLINITGKYFCNDTAAMPCANIAGSHHHWCIFDFVAVNPVSTDGWGVNRKYTPAVIIDNEHMQCRAPVIQPDAVPARPRALVGVILHGIFDQASALLLNPTDTIISSAFYIYHAKPQALRIIPGAGAYSGGTRITISGEGVFDSYRGCYTGRSTDEDDLPIGWAAFNCAAKATGTKLIPKAYCRFGQQVVTALIQTKQAATDPFVRNDLVCIAPAIQDPTSTQLGYETSEMSFSINGQRNEFSNSIPYRYAAQKVLQLIPTTGSAGAIEMLTVLGTNFINSPQLTCFFTPYVYSAWDATIKKTGQGTSAANPVFQQTAGNVPLGSLRLATKATYLDSESVVCPIPAAWEYPLKCTCKCGSELCGLAQTQKNLSKYEFPGSAPWTPDAKTVPRYSSKSMTSTVMHADCSKDESYNPLHPSDRTSSSEFTTSGSACQVRVQVGMNIQQLSHETAAVYYIYDIRMPEVHSVFPTSGPLSGGTQITIKGDRFPRTDGNVNFVTPRCVFGPNLYTQAQYLDSKTLTCVTPKACSWTISAGGVGDSVIGAPAIGTKCSFPFTWPPTNGKSQTACVAAPETGDTDYEAAVTFFGLANLPVGPFCATTKTFATDKQWGLCKCNNMPPGAIHFGVTFNLVFNVAPLQKESRKFIYFNDILLLTAPQGGLYPVAGTSDSPTSLRIKGSNFSDSGQTLRCMFADNFGTNVTTLATALSDVLLSCETPAKSDAMSFSIFVSVTGNLQQFSDRLSFMYYMSPIISKIHPTAATINLLATGKIDASLTSKYTMPAGPVSGGTKVTINGLRIIDKSRCPVTPNTGLIELVNGLTACRAEGSQCPTQMQCQFPFFYRKQGATGKQQYDECTKDDVKLKLGTNVAPGSSWCMVNYLKPGNQDFERDFDGNTIFEKSYMQCDCGNSVYKRLDKVTCGVIDKPKFPSYADLCPSTGSTLVDVTKIECRFGHQFVLAEIASGGGNGTDTIICTSPPYDFGVRVPLTVTLNRVDFTKVEKVSNCLAGTGEPCTYFQYLAPKPEISPAITSKGIGLATISPTFDSMRLTFNGPTDMGGQSERLAALYGENSEQSGCYRYLAQETIDQLGTSTMPTCKWSVAKNVLVITAGKKPTFTFNTQLFLTMEAGMEIKKIHVSQKPLVLVPSTPYWSDYYDGSTEKDVDPRSRDRDGFITNKELYAVNLNAIATDGTAPEIDPEVRASCFVSRVCICVNARTDILIPILTHVYLPILTHLIYNSWDSTYCHNCPTSLNLLPSARETRRDPTSNTSAR